MQAFLRDRCIKGDYTIPVADLWAAWKEWCQDQNRAIGTKATFGRDLASTAPTIRRIRLGTGDDRSYVYSGCTLGLLGSRVGF